MNVLGLLLTPVGIMSLIIGYLLQSGVGAASDGGKGKKKRSKGGQSQRGSKGKGDPSPTSFLVGGAVCTLLGIGCLIAWLGFGL